MLRWWLDRYYTDFEDWIAVATSGLSDAAKARLIEDMREHYAEAVSTLVARGVSREVAATEALEQLGQPTAVRREYERQFQLSPEMKTFFRYYDEMTRAKRNKYRLDTREMTVILVCLLCLISTHASSAPDASGRMPYFALFMVGGVIAPTFSGRFANLVAERNGSLNGYRTLLALRITQYMFLCAMGCVFVFIAGFLIVPGAIFSAIGAWSIVHELRTWRKIRPVIERVTN